MFQILAILSFAVSYITRALLFEERVSHYGPWPSKDLTVKRMRRDENYTYLYEQPVTFFDRIRFWTTRAYDIDHKRNEWFVREDRMEMWTCPKCLAFWVSGAVVVPYLFLTGQWKMIPVAWLAVAGGSHMIYKLTDVEIVVNNTYVDALNGDDDETISGLS